MVLRGKKRGRENFLLVFGANPLRVVLKMVSEIFADIGVETQII